MLRTLRACGVSAGMLNAVLLMELVSLALVAGIMGLVCGYLIAAWLLPSVPRNYADSAAGRQKNPLSGLSQWKILDNLRRSVTAPATLLLLVLGWTILPGHPAVWTAIALAAIARL